MAKFEFDNDDFESVSKFSIHLHDIDSALEEFERCFITWFVENEFEKRTSKTGRRLFKAYQQAQEALILTGKACLTLAELESKLEK